MSLRKIIRENQSKDLIIPAAAMRFSGFDPQEDAEYHAMDNAVAVLKREMTGVELLTAILSLTQLAMELNAMYEVEYEGERCEKCSDCESCPYDLLDSVTEIRLTDRQRAEAGIPEGALLCVSEHMRLSDRDEAALDGYIRDMPEDMLGALAFAGICPSCLSRMTMIGDAEYV